MPAPFDERPLNGLTVLIVDDTAILRRQLGSELNRLGADVTAADSLKAARVYLESSSFDFALLDVHLPDGLGTDLLKERAIPETCAVVVMTAEGGVQGAVQAMRLGADDYLVKPFDHGELPLVLQRARKSKHAARLEEYRADSEYQGNAGGIFFGSALASLESQLWKIIAADVRLQTSLPPVLIHGETGTGKTVIARWLHRNGPRAKAPLVEINCSAMPETLAESSLFGHEKGAFTDARSGRMGLFEAADGGTLFLDELPSLSPGVQAKVLTAIEDRNIRRVGGTKQVPVDVRIIAATNRDLKTLAAAGSFREDLMHRLDLFRICLPPLRERGDDILQLAEILVASLCKRHRLPKRTITADGSKRLLSQCWPGNVRELAHELERAIVFEDQEELDFTHLGGDVMSAKCPATSTAAVDGLPASEWFNEKFVFPMEGFNLEESINRLILHALKQSGQNVSASARLLGVTRDYVRYRLADAKGEDSSGTSASDQ